MAMFWADQGMGDFVEDGVAHLSLGMKPGQDPAEADFAGGEVADAGAGLCVIESQPPAHQAVVAHQRDRFGARCRQMHPVFLSHPALISRERTAGSECTDISA